MPIKTAALVNVGSIVSLENEAFASVLRCSYTTKLHYEIHKSAFTQQAHLKYKVLQMGKCDLRPKVEKTELTTIKNNKLAM